jgi:hypothetical protein
MQPTTLLAVLLVAWMVLAGSCRGSEEESIGLLRRTRGQTLSYIVQDQDKAVKLHFTTVHSTDQLVSTSLTMDNVAGYDLGKSQLLFLSDRRDRVSVVRAPRGQPEDHTKLLLFALRFLRGEHQGVQRAHAVTSNQESPHHKIVERELNVGGVTHQVSPSSPVRYDRD